MVGLDDWIAGLSDGGSLIRWNTSKTCPFEQR